MPIRIKKLNFKGNMKEYYQKLDSLIKDTDNKDIKIFFQRINDESKFLKEKTKNDIFIATNGTNTILGYVHGHKLCSNPPYYTSNYIYVSEQERKKNIGFKLKTAQITHARSIGIETITTTIKLDNKASIALHEKLGAIFNYNPVCKKYAVDIDT